ncbi:MAG: glycoside hydrolase family 9 protein [Oscillospiraceae bacterium]|nr:glycoside hydrolase family 9 protein [Oscillospiraceae bacterium]
MKKHSFIALTAALCMLCTGLPLGDFARQEMTVTAAEEEKPTYGVLTYTTEDGCVIISGCEEGVETVEIPSEIDGMPVTKIGPTAFYESSLKSIVIPEGVTTIASGAFWHCKSLAEIQFPSTLTTIEGFAFNDCQALETIEFPKSVTYIGNSAFGDTPWIAAQKEKDPQVVVNGILIDASEAVNIRLAEIEEEKRKAEEEAELAKIWKRAYIITNQIGYFKTGAKKATLLSDAEKAVKFELLDKDGKTVFSGNSTPMGFDEESGDKVHVLDFTEFTTEGTYTLKAGDAVSREFKIGVIDEMSGLTYDALNFFYQQRSSVAIESKYITSGDAEALARAAGHASDIADIYRTWGYEASAGKQDVTGGWYDAGDHGKYVVNAGVSLWLMQNQYERASANGTADVYADGTMQIPENDNGYPDLLDEARYEMEWMLSMIVQEGDCKDMVYHKVHGIKWTALATDPSTDKQRRIILPPTTAATLNLAACAAQSYRLWKELDAEFAEKCLTAAKNAYAAAQAYPEMYAPLTDTTIDGGGAYGDDNVTDEFYWAACELYAATGDETYYTDLQKSAWAFDVPSDMNGGEATGFTGSFDWGHTASLGSLTLTLTPDAITETEKNTLYESLLATADEYLHVADNQGYGLPYKGTKETGDTYSRYTWGSNSFVADNAVILSYAHEISKNSKYLNGAVSAMDYLLGRNPLDISYVTGYGVHTSQYPHHRWWAVQANPEFPKAPCGILVGGPNCGLEDPIVQDLEFEAGEVPPQTVYVDDIEAYSVNECAINWNAALAWLTSYLCEQNGGLVEDAPSAGVQIPEKEIIEDNTPDPVVITIPEGVTRIGEQIFGKKNAFVTEVVIPESVTAISKEAFTRCSKLTALNLPEAIEEIGDDAFSNTPWLKAQLAESPLLIINGLLIDGTSAKGEVVVPEGVTTILGSAFNLNKSITSVVISEGVETIGESAFYGCTALTSVKFPESLRTIEKSAFYNTGLTSLTIPDGVKEIGSEAFTNCKALTEATVLPKDAVIGAEAFGCTSTFTANGQYSYIFVHQVIPEFIVRCSKGSTAENYAVTTGVQVAYLDAAPDGVLYGDADCNGQVDILDVIMINRNVLGAETLSDAGKINADVDGDGKPSASDSLQVMKYVVKLVDKLPV